MKEVIKTHSEEETIRAGEVFATRLQQGDIVLLNGDLGAGKTHFAKGVARHYGVDSGEVQSPTFSLVHEYHGSIPLYHLDCYRLKKSEEAVDFGIEEYLFGDGISMIEWPERIASILPESSWVVEIRHLDENLREISIFKQD